MFWDFNNFQCEWLKNKLIKQADIFMVFGALMFITVWESGGQSKPDSKARRMAYNDES